MKGKAILYGHLRYNGITMGYANELSQEGLALLMVRVWDPVDREYYEFGATEYDLKVNKAAEEGRGMLLMSESDWERAKIYAVSAMDFALATRDYKWLRQLQRLNRHADKKLAQLKAAKVSPEKKPVKVERIKKPKKGVGVMGRNGKELGAEVYDHRNRCRGIIVGFADHDPQLALVVRFDPGMKTYNKWERNVQYLSLAAKDGSEKEVSIRDAEHYRRLMELAGDSALDTQDAEWFRQMCGEPVETEPAERERGEN